MKKLTYFWLVLIATLTIWGCSDSGSTGPDPDPGGEEASAEKKFVYNAMNYWYYWQGDVPELADNYFETDQDKQNYLSGFSDAEAAFNALLYEQEDDFSFFIDDYEEYKNRNRGINAAYGLDFAIITVPGQEGNESVFGYIRYVVPDSPSEEAGLKRGDIFTVVNGNRLKGPSDYTALLEANSTVTLELAEFTDDTYFEDGMLDDQPFELTGETVTIPSRQVIEDPVFHSTVIDTNGVRIGYLAYNAFQRISHDELNDEFTNFNSQGINTLVLDLRYNGGGSVLTSQILASMISGKSTSNVYAKLMYRDDRSVFNSTLNFLDEAPIANEEGEIETDENGNYINTEMINKLNINDVYVLTGFATASASEAVINGLKPYIDVTIIGEQTIGKDVGSITLFDSPESQEYPPFTNPDPAARNFEFALQPIVTKITNVNQDQYPDGFTPDVAIQEYAILLQENSMSPLGDTDEPLLAQAIADILGTSTQQPAVMKSNNVMFNMRPMLRQLNKKIPGSGMVIEPFMIPSTSVN